MKIERDHTELIKQYEADKQITDKPWELWQVYISIHAGWADCINPVSFRKESRYRRNPMAGKVCVHSNEFGWLWIDREIIEEAVEETKRIKSLDSSLLIWS